DDRRDGARRHPHDSRARHSDPRPGGPDLVGATAISGAGARRAEPVAGAVRRRAHLDVVRCAGRDDGRRLCGAVCIPSLLPLAAQRGINLHGVYALAWSLSTLTGALAGILMALDSGVTGGMPVIGLKAFPAALVGGLDSLVGALIGSLIVAAAEVLLIYYVDPLLSDVVPFLVLIVMPWGLFGTREELDRV